MNRPPRSASASSPSSLADAVNDEIVARGVEEAILAGNVSRQMKSAIEDVCRNHLGQLQFNTSRTQEMLKRQLHARVREVLEQHFSPTEVESRMNSLQVTTEIIDGVLDIRIEDRR